MITEVAVYIGSFDPLHLGHVEVIDIARKIVGNVVILPNNPRKGKPNRRSLEFRAHCLGLIYPLFASNDWFGEANSIVVDTRDCDTVLKILELNHIRIIGIIGSDVTSTKWHAHHWIVIERMDYPLRPFATGEITSRETQDDFLEIPLSQTRFQHLSSTGIKEDVSLKLRITTVPEPIIPYLYKKCDTLSRNMLDISFDNNKVIKTYGSSEYATEIGRKTIFVNQFRSGIPFQLAELIEVDGSMVTETFIPNEGTLADFIGRPTWNQKFRDVQIVLSEHLETTKFVHGDLSATNILCCTSNLFREAKSNQISLSSDKEINGYKFALIDYEKVRPICDSSKEKEKEEVLQEEVDRFYSSIAYYALLRGLTPDFLW